ncbi:NAD(+) synthase [Candidatus Uhrbacteria bacterium]|nr:NAD(+) synthase [Candidatus Uhrbacteria bacterium]
MAQHQGFVRIATAVPRVHVGDPEANVRAMVELAKTAGNAGAQVLVFPELGITGYTCRDLFLQPELQRAAYAQLRTFVMRMDNEACRGMLAIVGLPLAVDGQLFNVAAVVVAGEARVLAYIPKVYLPGYKEFEENRWFAPADRLCSTVHADDGALIGADILIDVRTTAMRRFTLGVEICEDLWMPIPPSSHLANQGATVLLNCSASNAVVGKADYRRELVRGQSSRCIAAYAYVSCGPGESTADVSFDGHAFIAENGSLLAESPRFQRTGHLTVADVDVERLLRERTMTGSFGQSVASEQRAYRRVLADGITELNVRQSFRRSVDPFPFVPRDPATRDARCDEVFAIQVDGLTRRLEHLEAMTGKRQVSIGISGGLDSTLALLVVVRAFQALGWDLSGIHAYTFPGFGTTDRTKSNAYALCAALGVPLREVSIVEASLLTLRQLGHLHADEQPHRDCLTCQNAQARIRTLFLMTDGFVIGTGDLSESALGWCTYNGDHMSMYNVNAGVPKTLVRYVVGWVAERGLLGAAASTVLRDILATPISPELDPVAADGQMGHTTEEQIGPYDLHDFFLFHFLRNGYGPRKIVFLAECAFANIRWEDGPHRGELKYPSSVIRKWLLEFFRRFPKAQFKRDAAPDGVKVGSVALSQRGDWRMPSDVDMALWVHEAEALLAEAEHRDADTD